MLLQVDVNTFSVLLEQTASDSSREATSETRTGKILLHHPDAVSYIMY